MLPKDAIGMIKIVIPRMVQEVADRAMQVHGGMGICQDTRYRNLDLWPAAFADGPDEAYVTACQADHKAGHRILGSLANVPIF